MIHHNTLPLRNDQCGFVTRCTHPQIFEQSNCGILFGAHHDRKCKREFFAVLHTKKRKLSKLLLKLQSRWLVWFLKLVRESRFSKGTSNPLLNKFIFWKFKKFLFYVGKYYDLLKIINFCIVFNGLRPREFRPNQTTWPLDHWKQLKTIEKLSILKCHNFFLHKKEIFNFSESEFI